jgi:predicted phosphodiesterase
MKIRAISDPHLEFHYGPLKKQHLAKLFPFREEPLIIAGDLEPIAPQQSLAHFCIICDSVPLVIYVPGNHDYYGRTFEAVEAELARIEEKLKPKLKILRTGEVFMHEGRRFLGDTMWVKDNPGIYSRIGMINDPFQIKPFYEPMLERNRRFLEFMESELKPGDVVVTHHLPSEKSTPAIFRNSPSQPWFLCDMESLIGQRSPAAWIHGHTHSRSVYKLGETQVICNPVGYPSENLGNLDYKVLEPSVFEV